MKTHFDFTFLETSTETLRAIAHPVRIAIIDLLFKNEQMSVTQIHEHLQIEQAVASHHLRILKNKNIVAVDRRGQNSFYYLANSGFHKIIDTLTQVC